MLSEVLPVRQALALVKAQLRRTYAHKGEQVRSIPSLKSRVRPPPRWTPSAAWRSQSYASPCTANAWLCRGLIRCTATGCGSRRERTHPWCRRQGFLAVSRSGRVPSSPRFEPNANSESEPVAQVIAMNLEAVDRIANLDGAPLEGGLKLITLPVEWMHIGVHRVGQSEEIQRADDDDAHASNVRMRVSATLPRGGGETVE
jgi:hypothetical protein